MIVQGYSSLETDWKAVVTTGMTSIAKSWNVLFPSGQPQIHDKLPNSDIAIKLFCSASRRLTQIRAFKIIQNIEVAAFHLAYLLKVSLIDDIAKGLHLIAVQGHLELPSTYPELMQELWKCVTSIFFSRPII